MTLTCSLVQNVFNPDKIEKRGIRGYEASVPSRIERLTIKFKPEFKLRAVVIVEHQNLNLASEAIKKHTKDIKVVQVCQSHSSPMAVLNDVA